MEEGGRDGEGDGEGATTRRAATLLFSLPLRSLFDLSRQMREGVEMRDR